MSGKRIKMASLQVRYDDGSIETWDVNPNPDDMIVVFPDPNGRKVTLQSKFTFHRSHYGPNGEKIL